MLRGAARGCPCPGAGVADERSQDGVAKSASSERRAGARSERPATGVGSPEPRERLTITCDPYDGSDQGAAASRMLRTIAGSVAIPSTPLTMNWMPMQRRRNPITFVRAFIPARPITATIDPESRRVA